MNQQPEFIRTDLSSETLIHIVGMNQLQNELLALYLESETGLKCCWGPKLTLPRIPFVDNEEEHHLNHLILLDCMGNNTDKLLEEFKPGGNLDLPQYHITLFNVKPVEKIEKKAMDLGVRGLFYKNTPLKIFPKAVPAILSGEIWYSRDVLSEYAMEPKKNSMIQTEQTRLLTSREKEILCKIASGASTRRIATDLSISPHTVKTHTYNIYKKIDVPNRYHATLWAARHLRVLSNS